MPFLRQLEQAAGRQTPDRSECLICLDQFEKDQMVGAFQHVSFARFLTSDRASSSQVSMLPCGHMFHNDCVSKWVVSRLTSGQVRTLAEPYYFGARPMTITMQVGSCPHCNLNIAFPVFAEDQLAGVLHVMCPISIMPAVCGYRASWW